MVFPWPTTEHQPVVFDEEMVIRLCNVCVGFVKLLAVLCFGHSEAAIASQDVAERALTVGDTCITIRIVAGRSCGNVENSVLSASTPPNEVPITMRS